MSQSFHSVYSYHLFIGRKFRNKTAIPTQATMPKKFDGENSKVAAARARKEGAKLAEQQKKQAAAEDEYWKDDDKHVQKKQQRKEEKDKKKEEQQAKKAALKTLAEQEMASIKVEQKQSSSKITRLQIQVSILFGVSEIFCNVNNKIDQSQPGTSISG